MGTCLEDYIQQARANQINDDQIKQTLIKSGWSEIDVNQAFSQSHTHETLVPPPPVPHLGMWVAFLYIILFICLYISFGSLGGILHYAVDKHIPDSADNLRYSISSYLGNYLLNGYIAGIIVTYPIFAILLIILKKQAVAKPIVKSLRARKFLIYLTLIGTFFVMIGHIISTLYSFLEGTTTLRIFAHLVVTLTIAGSVFTYLLYEVKQDRK